MRALAIAAIATAIVAAAHMRTEAHKPITSPFTFSDDVLPIVKARCASCHAPGGVAPMSLLSYEDARPWAKAIKSKVVAREMPPWGADMTQTLPMRNDISLSEKEIATIAA